MTTGLFITRDDVRWINKKYGGLLRNDKDIDAVLARASGLSASRQIAHMWKAILVDHPFTDGGRRAAVEIAMVVFEAVKTNLNENAQELLHAKTKRVGREKIKDIDRINMLVRDAAVGL